MSGVAEGIDVGPTLDLVVEHDAAIGPATVASGVPLVRRIALTNISPTTVEGARLSIWTEPELGPCLDLPLEAIPGDSSLRIDSVAFAPELAPLGVLAGQRVTLHVAVTRDDVALGAAAREVEVLERDVWPGGAGLPELLAAFVAPDDPVVVEVVAAAAKQRSADATAAEVFASLHSALQDLNLPPAATLADTGRQRIRPPSVWRDTGAATPLELATLLAACCERAGLRPILVASEDRIAAGAWLVAASFSRPVIHEGLLVKKRVDLDLIAIVDPASFAGRPAPVDDAKATARARIAELDAFTFAIDVAAARRHRIAPLDGGGTDQGGDVVEFGATTPEQRLVEQAMPAPRGRLDVWKQRLLDLTLRNRLLNFRATKTTVSLACTDLPGIEDAFATDRTFRLRSLEELLDQRPGARDDALDVERLGHLHGEWMGQGLLASPHGADELERRITAVYREARQALDEGGAGVLYLALGFLRWFEPDDRKTPRWAPILLVPLDVERPSVQAGVRVRLSGEEARINVSLLKKLELEFGVDTTELAALGDDDHGIDVQRTLDAFRRAVLAFDAWDVEDAAAIGLFSFTKFLMWLDLEQRTEELERSEVVRHLIERPNESFAPGESFPDPGELDATRPPAATFCPVDADSSQLAAVFAAADGRSFVLQGPPGTGKSQTITNLIAHCLAQGKRVLFVSEKMAALRVVHHRLASVGLAPFCLELHSNKAKKKQVLEQLGEALEVGTTGDPAAWQRTAEQLARARGELNAFCELLHAPRSLGVSAFEGIARAVASRGVPTLDLGLGDLAALDTTRFERLERCVDELALAAASVEPIAAHPFRHAGCREWDRGVERAVEQETRGLGQIIDRLQEVGAEILAVFGASGQVRSRRIVELLEMASALVDARGVPTEYLLIEDDEDLREQLDALVSHVRRRDELHDRLAARYHPALDDLDLDDLERRVERCRTPFLPLAWWRRRAVDRALASVLLPGRSAGATEDLLNDIFAARQRIAEDEAIDEARDLGRRYFGQDFEDLDGDELAAVLEHADEVRRTFVELAVQLGGAVDIGPFLNRHRDNTLAELGEAPGTLRSLRRNLTDGLSALDDVLDLDPRAFGDPDDANDLDRMSSIVSAMHNRRTELRVWTAYSRARWQAFDLGLGALTAALHDGEIAAARVRACFEASFFDGWVDAVMASEPELRRFSGSEQEHRIERFRALDRELMAMTRDLVYARLAARLPRTDEGVAASASSEVGVLRRQLQKSRGHWPIRRLIERIPNLLPRLKPCFLMSPLSVAQYLDPGMPQFDLVVFDEASQIPVWDAIGAIGRGTHVVVVGDSRQLPPTSFFQTSEEEEVDEEEIEELESILDECVAAQIPSRQLLWHYRSRHESLIAFSNHHYYQGALLTFPTPAERSARLGVTWQHVPGGVYDRARTRANQAEAEAVVAELVERVKNEPGRSLGVVTFSRAQQALVEDLLDRARASDAALDARLAAAHDEPLFVKNLENVQGDERDVILFSVCYGPDAQGRVFMNFGPLNQPGGERRLNVAITRAREKVVVFSTLRPDQIDLARVSSAAVGVRHLKTFLEYAERGPMAMAEVQRAALSEVSDGLDRAVASALEERGWTVRRRVGCSGYRVDLAVVDRVDPARLVLGIECDGATYRDARTARDRDRLRHAVMTSLGWRLTRVWSADWFFDSAREIERIVGLLESPAEGVPPPEPMATPTDEPSEATEAPRVTVAPYRAAPAPRTARDPDSFLDADQDRAIEARIREVLAAEAPISAELLLRRVAVAWGLERITPKVRDRIGRRLVLTGAKQHAIDEDTVFVWRDDQDPAAYRHYRTGESDRESADIAPEEWANAASAVLAASISLPPEDLIREVARQLGFARVGRRVKEDASRGIDLLIARGDARRVGDDLVLAAR